MNPVVLMILQFAIQYGPAAAQAVQAILGNPNPSQADWDKLWAVATSKSYDAYIAAAAAKAGVPVPAAPGGAK